jgi:hypothetical protein
MADSKADVKEGGPLAGYTFDKTVEVEGMQPKFLALEI